MKLFFDTETTGVPKNYNAPVSDVNNWPRLVQLGMIVMNEKKPIYEVEYIVRPYGFEIPVEASNVHGITTERALKEGLPISEVLDSFLWWAGVCDTLVGHNIDFDMRIVGAEVWRKFFFNPLDSKKTVCTMKTTAQFVGIPRSGGFKYPKLHELYRKLFNEDMGAAHTALQDISNTAKYDFALVERGIIT